MTPANLDLTYIYAQLTQFAGLENFWQLFDSVYTAGYDATAANTLRSQWVNGNFSQIPQIILSGDDILGNAQGAYAASNNTIYLAETFVATAAPEALSVVILEEIGHFVDAQINATDTPGDEGELFSLLVRGITPTDSELNRIQTLRHEQQVLASEVVERTSGIQTQPTLDHDHDGDHICTDGQMPGEFLAGNPPTYTGESSLASFAELSQQNSGFIPASVAGSVLGQPGLAAQLPLVQGIAVVGAVRNGSLQLSNSATVAIQATLGRALGAGESLRYSLDAGASWIDVSHSN